MARGLTDSDTDELPKSEVGLASRPCVGRAGCVGVGHRLDAQAGLGESGPQRAEHVDASGFNASRRIRLRSRSTYSFRISWGGQVCIQLGSLQFGSIEPMQLELEMMATAHSRAES